ncbi:ABC transporter related protein [Arcobacter nitrofigilis DSM 7299]|uniref:ABC transporter related protein n=1 Tax=Arcobacter nitrofigilis (strain ATCC 33309 / DSM 7299 / CCUG 15893 / LMG 7604 / NCTC 12251 / CI) TaxID=572480 RepID=D5V6T7_ARCNC|nr:ABC transporter ATP-binding protein [Arcobacter nitrofigilis]ADG94357.1 ABC transporter related protein [Arcobacter nitrofigilis DSM 7299]
MYSFLKIDNLSIDFKTRNGTVHGLKNASMNIQKGEVLGVIGESGSGKSITAFTVMGLLDSAGSVTNGKIEFEGFTLTTAKEKDLKEIRGREISMIFQNPRAALNPIRCVGKQIEDVLICHHQASPQNAKEKAIKMLEKVKIVNPQDRYWSYPFELSGGMCQRVMIAIAIACNPRLLIADEPTTGLDVTTQKVIMDLIKELAKEHHMAVMLITHDLGMAAMYCDNICVMQKGEIVEKNSVYELFTKPKHPYTIKLIAASPGPKSKLSDLTAIPEEMEGEKVVSKKQIHNEITKKGEVILEVLNLVKKFPLRDKSSFFAKKKEENTFTAVNGISFNLKKGESLGLVGESGCGKSTTSNMITKLLDPTSGDIILENENITAYTSKQFAAMKQRNKIQMVFQDPTDSLNPRFNAFDCIAEPLRRLLKMRDRKKIKEKVEELSLMVGLPIHLLSRFPHQLSGGQKARVGIARAISVNPKILILDEPTSALDVSVQAVVLQLLDRLKKELGMSYIFVSHDLNVVKLLCERVIVMNRGEIVEQGTVHDILENPQKDYTKKLIASIPHFEPNKLKMA